MYGQQSLLYRDEDDLMFPMEATEEEEVTRRSTDWVGCEEAVDGLDDGGRLPRPESLKFSGDKGDSLDQKDNFYWRNTPHPLSNVSSVGMEEVIEDIIRGSSKAIEKTGAEALESKSKSPKYFPKFLRSSFSRLISRDKSKTGSLSGGEPVSIPSLSSPSPSLYLTDTSSDTLEDPLASSPTTQQFVEDTLARGFPLIPFHYTSMDIVEKGRTQQRIKEPAVSPARTKCRRLPQTGGYEGPRLEDDLEERSLQSVLNLAQQQLELEAQTCELAVGCRGRRSSVTDYVELNHDAMILSTVSRARSARSLRSKRQMWSKSASVQQ